jgi:hypothetical protein
VSVLLHHLKSGGGETWVSDEFERVEKRSGEKKASRHKATRDQVTEEVR